jgi:membrane fusion protein (multidrug efflux system)
MPTETLELPKAPPAGARSPNAVPPKKPADPEPPKSKRTPLLILTLVVLIAAVAGLVYYLHARNFEETDDAFIDGHVVAVSPRIAGRVEAVLFNDNDEVTKGQLLVQLDPSDATVALERARAQLAQAQAQVLQAQAQTSQSQGQLAQAEAQTAQQAAQADVAGINFQRNNSLYARDLRAIAKQEVDTTKSTFDAATASRDAAQANVVAMRASVEASHASVASAEANVGAATAAVHDAELQLSYTKILASETGRIARKQVEPGNYVQPATQLCSLVQHDVWVTANYKETQLRRMREGQPVEVTVDAYPDQKLKAHVQSLQPGTGSRFSLLPAENATGNYVKTVQRLPVKIVFDEKPDVLRRLAPGMSVEPSVDLR